MTLLQTIADELGDILGTSKLAKLNKRMFNPVLGTDITRKEYNQAGHDWIEVPDASTAKAIRTSIDQNSAVAIASRQQVAIELLSEMTQRGTVFEPNRYREFIVNLQTVPGINPISSITDYHLNDRENQKIDIAMRRQSFLFRR